MGYRLLLASFSVRPFSFIRSTIVRSMKFRQIMNWYVAYISSLRTPAILSKKFLSPSSDQTLTTHHYYDWFSLFGETIRQKNLLQLPSLYEIKCLGEQGCRLEVFCANSIYDLMYYQDLWCIGSISAQTFLILSKKISSVTISMRLCSRALSVLAATKVRVMPR